MNTIRYLSLILLSLSAPIHSQTSGSCVAATKGLQSMHTESILLINDLGAPVKLDVLVADDEFERASGFQHICPQVIDAVRILFRYDTLINVQFHMRNVQAPLDIAFFDDKGRLIKSMLMHVYSTASQPLYGPSVPFQYALEASAGWLRSNGLKTSRSFIKFNRQ